jgi:tRNA-binding EMAP/Myf-like protein
MIEARVVTIDSVRKHPDADRLTIVAVSGNDVVANLHEDGTPRWVEGELCVYVPENAVVPESVLKERGYWEPDAKKGLLGGSKGNRVKMQRFAGFESRGIIFKVEKKAYSPTFSGGLYNGSEAIAVNVGDDVAEFLGITEYVAKD